MSVAAIPVAVGRVEGTIVSRSDDLLAAEEPLEIRLGQESLSVTMRTPGDDFELAAGFLFSEGIIGSASQISSMGRLADGSPDIVVLELDGQLRAPRPARRNFTMTSACGVCGKASLRELEMNACPALPHDEIRISPDILHRMPDRLRGSQKVFDGTGGLHAAALFNLRGHLESLREDIGRHNAVDKLIGAALLNHRTPLSNSLLLVSGRASFELVQKALVAGIPFLASVGAPSSLAVATAERAGMTLVGFLRNGRFNVYTEDRRILKPEHYHEG
jgi:FdhD protein